LSAEPHNQKPKISALRFAHGQTKVPNLFQDLTRRFWEGTKHLRSLRAFSQIVVRIQRLR
jgi:hypothetical protein